VDAHCYDRLEALSRVTFHLHVMPTNAVRNMKKFAYLPIHRIAKAFFISNGTQARNLAMPSTHDINVTSVMSLHT
jgi:hypothetical protein